VPTSGNDQGSLLDGSLLGGKSRLNTVSLEITSKSSECHEQRAARHSKSLDGQKHGRLLKRNWGYGVALTLTRWQKNA